MNKALLFAVLALGAFAQPPQPATPVQLRVEILHYRENFPPDTYRSYAEKACLDFVVEMGRKLDHTPGILKKDPLRVALLARKTPIDPIVLLVTLQKTVDGKAATVELDRVSITFGMDVAKRAAETARLALPHLSETALATDRR